MTPEKLDKILSKIPRPAADPGPFREAVWRKIHLRRRSASHPFASERTTDPGWPRAVIVPVCAACAAVILTTAFAALALHKPSSSPPAQTAARALGLSVFSPNSEALAHNRLAPRR